MLSSSQKIIEKFGGPEKLAGALGHKHDTTVRYWKKIGYVPPRQQSKVLAASNKLGCGVVPEDFLTVTQEQVGQ